MSESPAQKSFLTGRKPVAFALAGLSVLLLAGCQSKAQKEACPVANVLANTAELFVFKKGMEGDLSGELYHVEVTGVHLSCDFDKLEGTTNSDIEVDFKATRAPTGDAANYTVPYFITSVLNGAEIQNKKILATPFSFAPGEATVTFTAETSSFRTKFANGKKPYEYGILAGIQLTREELDYSNKRRGFTPMIALSTELSAIAGAAFAAEGLSEGFGQVQRSDRPDLAQFQCNGALAAAKAARTNPRAIAQKVADRLKANPLFAKVEIAGPGFINLDLTDAALAARGVALAKDEKLGAPDSGAGKALVIDFGGPNVAKPMHVGHLRSSVIGDSLQRLFRANGWTVTSDIHLGDWGLQMGQLISEIAHRGVAPIYFDANFTGPYPQTSPVTMDDLEEIYPAASAACKADEARLAEARRATADLQAGRPGYRALWQHFFDVSKVGLDREFSSLGVHFDMWKGEASVDPITVPMVEDLKARQIAVESDGALVIPVERNTDKKEMPPLILVKQDGAVLYGTTDLATIIDRVRSQNPDLVLYVVDQRQHLHFEQVFRAAEKAGLAGKATLEHSGFGTMNGTDGKPFKTREGGVMKLFDLIAMVTAEAEKRLTEQGIGADYPADERADIAKKVGIATLKFADLSNYRLTDYVFDIERFSRFEGKTGPYLQYAAVRIQSILRRAAEQGFAVGDPAIRSAEERNLFLQVLALPDAMVAAEKGRAPNILCDYAFTLAQLYSRFYAEHHILSESDAAVRAARLGLCKLTLAVMIKVLALLGIEVPERM